MNINHSSKQIPMSRFLFRILTLLLTGLCLFAATASSSLNESAETLSSDNISIAPPVFMPAGGSFNKPISVTILADDGLDIYFTTNGKEPSVSEDDRYNGAIVISATTTIMAIAADSNGNVSSVAKATYTCTRHGIGEDYNPDSPGNPGSETVEVQDKKYKLTVVVNPTGAGYASANSYELKSGEQTWVYARNDNGFSFKNWTIEGEEVTNSPEFSYVMPGYDVTIVANYEYNPASPGNPSPEEQKVKHPVVVRSMPSGAASLRPSGAFDMEENSTREVYAYPNKGWKLTGWTINGEAQEQTTSPLTLKMGEKALDIAASFIYEPSSPSNPDANYYNSMTGQVIIDDFTPGYLYNALSDLVGYDNFSNISSLIVKGKMNSNDLGNLNYFSNARSIDLSRTGGILTLPSYTFESIDASSIVLPSTVTNMGNYAFRNCSNLASLTIYAQEPPTCNSSTFSNFTNKANCTIYVPASAIELYTNADYWKDFTILPITNDAHMLQVNLPEDASDGRYKHNSIEIVNINSGVRQKYVISDRMLYTFNGLQKDEQYNIYMFSQAGLEIGSIENVVIPDQDIEVSFDNLKSLHTVFAKVLDTNGSDVTSNVSVEWYKPLADGTATYLRKAISLGEIPDGQQLICHIALDNQLGVVYLNPEDVEFTVTSHNNTCVINLVPFRSIELSGTIVDGDGAPLSGASVSVNQTLNNKHSKTYTTKTDRKGGWRLSVLDAPETRLTYAATECVNVNDTIGGFESNINTLDVGQTTLKSIVGARISYNFTYQAAGTEDAESYYSDYQNVTISVFNTTQNRAHDQLSLQYPVLAVLDENIHTGDELKLTATSKTGAFNPIVKTVTIGEDQRGDVTFEIIGKGGITASFEMTDNPAVVAMLYDSKGELLKKTTYSEATTTFTQLEDGNYTLISMGQSDLMNSILRLSNFDEIGLKEGTDYVKNVVSVETGRLTEVTIPEVPAFDESLFYYTNSNTSFSSNKSSVTTGNYLTLRAAVDFKGVYKNDISNVALVVDLPEACDFVEQSVIQGPNLLPYTLDNHRLTVQLGNNYQSQTRFCIIPTSGGLLNSTASIIFDYNGKTITQPIGSTATKINDLSITLPSVSANDDFKVSGSGPANSAVNVYANNQLVGSGRVNSYGFWNVACSIDNPYNLSTYNIYADIITSQNAHLLTETRQFTYDKNAIGVSKVTLLVDGQTIEWDFQNPEDKELFFQCTNPQVYTFTVSFTDNDPEKISNVIVWAERTDGVQDPLPAHYNEEKGLWVASTKYNPAGLGPVNVSIDFDYCKQSIIDARKYSDNILEEIDRKNELRKINKEIKDYINNENTSILDIDNQTARLTEVLSIIESSSFESSHSHIASVLNLLNSQLDETSVAPDNIEITDENVISFIESGQSLLNSEKYDFTELDLLISAVNQALEDSACDEQESINSIDDEEFIFDNDGIKFCYKEIDIATVDENTLSYQEKHCLNLSDGSSIICYTDDLNWTIIDKSNNKAYVIAALDVNSTYRAKSPLKAPNVGLSILKEAQDKLSTSARNVSSWINDLTESFRKDIKKYEDLLKQNDANADMLLAESASKGQKIADIEKQLANCERNYRGGAFIDEMNEYKSKLVAERNQLLKDAERMKKNYSMMRRQVSSIRTKLFGLNALLNEAMDYWEIVNGLNRLIWYASTGINDYIGWNSFINTLTPCPDDPDNANSLVTISQDNRNEALGGYIGSVTLSGISSGISIAMKVQKGPVKWVLKTLAGIIAGALLDIAEDIYNDAHNGSVNNMNLRIKERASLKCHKDCGQSGQPPCPDDNNDNNPENEGNGNNSDGGAYKSGYPNSTPHIDPSGFVYEAVPSNRVAGVQASCYYEDTYYDIYDDPHKQVVLWDAEKYGQLNPQLTNEEGRYRWDVPAGLWQVKYEKDGYQTAFSEWLPVPPPQLEVNIGIVQNKQPEVTEARAYEEGIEVQFDKFMDPSTLTTSNIYVTANGEKLNGEIRLLDSELADEFASEDDANATRYASRVRFIPEQPLSATTGEIRVTVSRNVLSYAGIPMTETFSQVLDVEKEVQVITAEDVKVLYGGEKEVTVYALPFEAAAGRTLHIANSSDLIASIDVTEATIDEEGKAILKVKGDLPGTTQLSFTIDDVTATGECTVDVVTEILTAEAPKSSRASGTAVYRGTKIELTSDSKNATIYFTTDGSCPCDENGTRRKYTVPIIINEDTKILAMTSVGNGDEDISETVEFNYTLKHSDMDFQMSEGWTWISHNFDTPITPTELTSDQGVSRILSQSQEVIRDPQMGIVGNLTELDASESYKIETANATARKRLSDIARNPATPIAINSGWNWLGYPVAQTMSVDEAFATTEAETLDVVVGQNGFAQFDGENWVGTLETMSPGMGYMYQSLSAKNIVYNTSVVSTASARYASGISSHSPLALDIHKYGVIMPVIATLNGTDGTQLDNEDYQIAAFCGTECRGIGRVVNGLVMMNVYGNLNDNITFRVTDANGEINFPNNASLQFCENVVGNVFSPYAIAINGQSGISNVRYEGNIKVYVENDMLRIKGISPEDIDLIEIYDINGRKLIRETNVPESGIRISSLTNGIYVVIVKGNGEYTYHKISTK